LRRLKISGEASVMAGAAKAANDALAELVASGIELSDFSMGQPSLDEVFFAPQVTELPPRRPTRNQFPCG